MRRYLAGAQRAEMRRGEENVKARKAKEQQEQEGVAEEDEVVREEVGGNKAGKLSKQ